jgi:Fe-S-cluster containining protein
VDIRKDQQLSDNSLIGPDSSADRPEPPVNTGVAVGPQKSIASAAEGPVFDFASLEVSAAEEALREAAADLKSSLEVLADKCGEEEGYRALQAGLQVSMPDLYRKYDSYVAAVLGTGEEKVACSKGCSHCCSHYVTSVEPYELLFLHGRIRGDDRYPSRVIGLHRRASLFNSLRDASTDDEAEDRTLYRYYLRGTPCPFLGEGGKCGVYDSRPMSCRMFFSMSHPSLCKGKAVITPGNRNFLIELPEDIEADLARAGALFADSALPESLFEGLLKVNELFGRFDEAG